MNRRSNLVCAMLLAGASAALAVSTANAASETTRRNTNAVQNYQNRQQGPYYPGQSNPYYGTSTQGAQGYRVPPRPADSGLQNRLREIERNRNGQ